MIAYFKSKAGRVIARSYDKRAPPKAIFDGDDWYERDESAQDGGVPEAFREFCMGQDHPGLPNFIVKDRPVISMQAPLKGGRFDDPKNPAPAYTKDLQPVFSNRRQMKEWAKRSANEHGSYEVDD